MSTNTVDTPEPLPAEVDRYITTVYGPEGDRADWARAAAHVLLDGGEPTEPMPRDRYNNTRSRIEALRVVVERGRS